MSDPMVVRPIQRGKFLLPIGMLVLGAILGVGLDRHNLCAHFYQCLDRLAKVCADVEAQISGLEHGAVKAAVRLPVSSM